MFAIRMTLKDGSLKFVSEYYPYWDKRFVLNDNISKCLPYKSKYEFMCIYAVLSFAYNSWSRSPYFLLENEFYGKPSKQFCYDDVIKFETINLITLENIEFDVKEQVFVDNELQFNNVEFNYLIDCPCTSSHWNYIDEKWIGFPQKKDYAKINKIKYYKRGLVGYVSDVFVYRNSKSGLPVCRQFYERRKSLIFNEEIQKVYLSKLGSCDKIVIVRSP